MSADLEYAVKEDIEVPNGWWYPSYVLAALKNTYLNDKRVWLIIQDTLASAAGHKVTKKVTYRSNMTSSRILWWIILILIVLVRFRRRLDPLGNRHRVLKYLQKLLFAK